jgi:hypothetical protein
VDPNGLDIQLDPSSSLSEPDITAASCRDDIWQVAQTNAYKLLGIENCARR